MRQEPEVVNQLRTFAQQHEIIRAVVMNGSRVNPNLRKDFFCDYDVVNYTTEPRRFVEDQTWIQAFGDLVILQLNEYEFQDKKGFIFLMLFTDGVRIDLSFAPLETLENVNEDSLAVLLLDKDGRISQLPPPSETSHFTTRPTAKAFAEAINEILWCSNNVAKGLWRDELPYAKAMLEVIIRPCFLDLVSWYIAAQHNWHVNTGMFGKWFKKHLTPETWQSLIHTYAGSEKEALWDSLFEILKLTRQVGVPLAQELGYPYPLEDDSRMNRFLRQARKLPQDATAFDA